MASVSMIFPRPPGLSQLQWRLLSGQALLAMRNATPVDTTRLRRSWEDPVISRRSIKMHTNDTAPYASYVQNGESPHPKLSAKQEANKGFVDRGKAKLSQLAGVLKEK